MVPKIGLGAGTYGCKSLMALGPQGLFSDLIFGPEINSADGLVGY